MKPIPEDPWLRLAALARPAADSAHDDPAADHHDDARFADEVLRRLAIRERARTAAATSPPAPPRVTMPWESWGLRGLGAAVALTAVMLFWNLPLLSADTLPEDLLPPDSVAELTDAF